MQQVITIERKKYATGLFWQPVGLGVNARVFANKLSKNVPGRIKYFTDFRGMIGIGSMSMGHNRRMPSAAAEVVEAFSEYNSFLAAFSVKQGIYLVAVRNNIIIADKLYGGEDEAKQAYEEFAALPDWGLLVSPAAWLAPRAEEKLINETVTGEAKQSMHPVSNLGGWILSILLIIIFLVGAIYMFRAPMLRMIKINGKSEKFDVEAIENYKRRLAEQDRMLVDTTGRAAKPIEMPFDALPDMHDRANLCYAAIIHLMQVVPGWNQSYAECGEGVATAQLHRTFGTIIDVYDFVATRMPGVEVIENSDSDIVLSMQLQSIPTESRLSDFPIDAAVRNINSTFQLMGAAVDVRPAIETVAGPNGSTESVNVVLVSAVSKLTPDEFVKIFEDYYAVALTSIRWTARDRTWNYEVKIYVK